MDKRLHKWMRRMDDEQLCSLSELVSAEIDRRTQRRFPRAYVRSTYMSDMVRGERKAEPRRLRWAA